MVLTLMGPLNMSRRWQNLYSIVVAGYMLIVDILRMPVSNALLGSQDALNKPDWPLEASDVRFVRSLQTPSFRDPEEFVKVLDSSMRPYLLILAMSRTPRGSRMPS